MFTRPRRAPLRLGSIARKAPAAAAGSAIGPDRAVPDLAAGLVPAGLRLRPDPGTRLVAGGSVLVGGSPVRVLRLTPAGARQVARWLDGAPLPANAAARRLARRLLDAGIVNPEVTGVAADGAAVPSAAAVTVVIPVRDRHAELARCLSGLTEASAAQPARITARSARGSGARGSGARGTRESDATTGPRILVIDDASADPAAIAAIAAAHGARVIHRQVNGGPGAARNTGLAAAETEFVAFLDSDCVPGPGWLDRLLPHFADPAVGAVAPRIVAHEAGTGWLARYEGASSTLDMGSRPSIVRPGARVSYVPGAALVVRGAAAGDGFAGGMYVGEDVDFVWRMSAAGWRVRYEPAAVMGHDHRVRLRAWFARRADYGTSAAALERLHPGAARPLYASWWTVGAWAAVLSGRPLTAAALTGAATALLARRLSRVTGERWPLPCAAPTPNSDNSKKRVAPAIPTASDSIAARSTAPATPVAGPAAPAGPVAWRLAARLAAGGTLGAGRPLGAALSRTWWPVVLPAALAIRGLRLPVAALILVPPLLDWADRRPPLDPARYVAVRLLDDAAYSLGVWQGCLARRTFRPLLPVLGTRNLVVARPRPGVRRP